MQQITGKSVYMNWLFIGLYLPLCTYHVYIQSLVSVFQKIEIVLGQVDAITHSSYLFPTTLFNFALPRCHMFICPRLTSTSQCSNNKPQCCQSHSPETFVKTRKSLLKCLLYLAAEKDLVETHSCFQCLHIVFHTKLFNYFLFAI